jgi:hypothetical protein
MREVQAPNLDTIRAWRKAAGAGTFGPPHPPMFT